MAARRRHNAFSQRYSMGDRGFSAVSAKYQDRRLQDIKAKDKNYTPCPRCKRLYQNPENLHYADFKNKIRCMEPIR